MQSKSQIAMAIVAYVLTLIVVILWIFTFKKVENEKSQNEYNSMTEQEIVMIHSVDLENQQNGIFILGLGWETGEKVYYVYKITDDGGKKLENKKVKKDAVKELLV